MLNKINETSALNRIKKKRYVIVFCVGQVCLHIIGNIRVYQGLNYL